MYSLYSTVTNPAVMSFSSRVSIVVQKGDSSGFRAKISPGLPGANWVPLPPASRHGLRVSWLSLETMHFMPFNMSAKQVGTAIVHNSACALVLPWHGWRLGLRGHRTGALCCGLLAWGSGISSAVAGAVAMSMIMTVAPSTMICTNCCYCYN